MSKHVNTTKKCINEKCNSRDIRITECKKKVVNAAGTFTRIAKCLKCKTIWRVK